MELFKGDAVKFFGIEKKVGSAARTELSHIHIQKNIDDWMLLMEDDSYTHFEFQTTQDKTDLPRFMVADAVLYYKERKPIRTIVVYSADITDTITTLDTGSMQYSVDAFYMAKLDGDKTYDEIRAKVESGTPLTKQDLMSIVFLPLMKNSVDKNTRLEQSITLSKEIKDTNEQLQIQAMLTLLAEKFVMDEEQLSKLKGLVNMTTIIKMISEDVVRDERIEIAKNALRKGLSIEVISEITGLDESTIRQPEKEMTREAS